MRLKLGVALLVLACVGVITHRALLGPGDWSVSTAQDALAVAGKLAIAAYSAGEMAYETVSTGKERAPAVLVGLGVLVAVPLIAALTLALRQSQQATAAKRTRQMRARRVADAAALLRPGGAWIDIDGPRRTYLRMEGELLRIGRDWENDLRLEDPNVHLHHALIQRTPDAEFVLLDVSGARGNGTMVNGRRTARVRLKDGDLIELGKSRMRFRCELVSNALRA